MLLLCSAVLAQAPPANVVVSEAATQNLTPTNWVSGTVVSQNDAQLALETSGRLIKLAQIGQLVERGELLAKIDDAALQLSQAELSATVESRRLSLAYLESVVARQESLAGQDHASKNELEKRVSEREVAKAELAVARARLAQTTRSLEQTVLLAPFAGVVSERIGQLGEYVDSGKAVVRLVATEELEIVAPVPVVAYNRLKAGVEVRVESPFSEEQAEVKTVVPVADSRSHQLQIRVDASHLSWPVGTHVRVAIPAGDERQVVAVPRDALVLRRDGTSLFKVDAENNVQKVEVETGLSDGDLIEVKGDLKAGDRVVIRGAERLRPGQAVQVKER